MLIAALRDIQWRRRRFLIAAAGTSLVFALTLVMAGVSAGFGVEARATVRDIGADHWLVPDGAAGPFLGAPPMPQARGEQLVAGRGRDAGFIVFGRKTVAGSDGAVDVNVMGALPGRLGMPDATSGRSPRRSGEVAVSTRLAGFGVGDAVDISGRRFAVVGEVEGATALAGAPNVYVTLGDAQRLVFGGAPAISSVVVRGSVPELPAGIQAMDRTRAADDLLRAVEQARAALQFTTALLWIVAAAIIGSVVYISTIERQRDFAVFKATGVSTRAILAGLTLQAVIMAAIAALVGIALAAVIGPRFPMQVSIDNQARLLLPATGVVIGLVASVAGMRRAVAVDPALAFAGP